jgi:outer membrane receptor protein involved in Fe transport
MMLRFAATQTVSRPEYRELSPVPYFEQIGLLTTFGNPDLNRALVQNLDARWEWYPRAGELISAGVFAKFFSDPIEKVIVLQAGTQALSFVNAEKATNYGIELEVRKGFFQAGGLPRLTTFANLTLMASDITPGNEGISSLTNPNRPMVGQSAYVVNAGFTTNPWNNGLAMSLLYNVAGRRILEAGAGGLPDAYEEARHIIDATVQWPVGQVVLKFEARNLLDAPYRLTQGDVIRQRWLLGRQFGIGVTWQP